MRATVIFAIASLFVFALANGDILSTERPKVFEYKSQEFVAGWHVGGQLDYNETIINDISDALLDPDSLAVCLTVLGGSDAGSRFVGILCVDQLIVQLAENLQQEISDDQNFSLLVKNTTNELDDPFGFINTVNDYIEEHETNLWGVLKQSAVSAQNEDFYNAGLLFGSVIYTISNFEPGTAKAPWRETLKQRLRAAANKNTARASIGSILN
eukprot:TRINITY_DN3980_c0_g3_i3.p1 TRINITY_DN3980_c0_g3~~TRINITY_DN3980_c0_g3_i3.p1  ORF type:complete len:212 (+),score=50.96 TRINITY_DN3980_c0_g3_i3:52-687(+)